MSETDGRPKLAIDDRMLYRAARFYGGSPDGQYDDVAEEAINCMIEARGLPSLSRLTVLAGATDFDRALNLVGASSGYTVKNSYNSS